MGKLSPPETRTSRTSWRQKDMPGSNLQYERDFAGLNGETPDWIRGLRKEAFDRFVALGFPTTEQEAWKFTSIAAIAATPFRLHPAASRAVPPVGSLPAGAFVGRISEGLRACPEAIRRHLGRVASFGENPFTALKDRK